jgi:hypothetical protein
MRIRLALVLGLLPAQACVPSFASETFKTERKEFGAAGISIARLRTGAGKLDIRGRAGADRIEVLAEFRGPEGASARLEEELKLEMETRGGAFELRSENRERRGDHQAWIDLTITVPASLALDIRDGSGDLLVRGMDADVTIDDGSGDIEVEEIRGSLRIKDGSGGIRVRDVGRDLEIDDGSGSIDIAHVRGNVHVDDGAGSIRVEDVGGRLEVPHAGSGSVRYRDVRGEIRVPHKKVRAE